MHALKYLAEGEEVTVGRPDTDSYGIVGTDGAELMRRLEAGATPREAAAWYEAEYGEPVDVDDVLVTLEELGFVRSADEVPPETAPVRWKRLGAAAFSAPAWILYGVLAAWALVATVRRPDLMPSYRHMFFTDYYTVIQVLLFASAVPQLLLHEGFHALAGRRLGVRSSLSVGRRFYFVVLETSMDGLVAVPRRKRYLPILAGMLADVVVAAVLTIVADVTRDESGAFSLGGRICLAVALAVWLRIAWQFSFYLRTDLYVLISTAIGCVDLHAAAKGHLRNRVNRVFGRRERLVDESSWHPADRRAALWYSWLLVVGYSVSIVTLAVAVGPITIEMFTGVLRPFTDAGQVTWQRWLDSAVFTGLALVQVVILGWLVLRDRRKGKSP